MIRVFVAIAGLCTACLLGVILLVVGLVTQVFGAPMGINCASSKHSMECFPDVALSSVAMAAQELQEHIFGVRANQYDAHDPIIQRILPYWMASCSSGGQLCPEAQSGNLQCVEFVSGAFFLGGDPLPGIANAEDLWLLYQHRKGWTEIPATAYPPEMRGMPLPGDMMVWRGGGHMENGQYVEYGHVAIVIAVSAPQAENDGFITVAEGNAPGNRWDGPHVGDPGNWYTMPLHPDLSVETWGAFTDTEGVRYDGYTVLGYIRQSTSQDLPPVTSPVSGGDDNAAFPVAPSATTVSTSSDHPVPRGDEDSVKKAACLDRDCSSPLLSHPSPVIGTRARNTHHHEGQSDESGNRVPNARNQESKVLYPAQIIRKSLRGVAR